MATPIVFGKSDGDNVQIISNNNNIFKFKRSEKKSKENQRLLAVHPVECLVMEKLLKAQIWITRGHHIGYFGGPLSLVGPANWIWYHQVKKLNDLAKTADKYNRRNYIDLLDKMDAQIKKIKHVLPLLLLQAAVIIAIVVAIMVKQYKEHCRY